RAQNVHDPSDTKVARYALRRTSGPCGNTQVVAKLRQPNTPGRPSPIARAPNKARATLYAAGARRCKITFVGYVRSLIREYEPLRLLVQIQEPFGEHIERLSRRGRALRLRSLSSRVRNAHGKSNSKRGKRRSSTIAG